MVLDCLYWVLSTAFTKVRSVGGHRTVQATCARRRSLIGALKQRLRREILIFAANSTILCSRVHPIDPPLIIAIPFIHMRARYMTRVHVLAPWRSIVLNLCFSDLIQIRGLEKNFDVIVLDASLYLGAVRARHDEPFARSSSFAQLELPGLEARRQVRSLS